MYARLKQFCCTFNKFTKGQKYIWKAKDEGKGRKLRRSEKKFNFWVSGH